MAVFCGEDEIKFSSGRSIGINAGIVGIDPDLKLSYGYDGKIDWPIPDWWNDDLKTHCLHHEDMRELADVMIERWTKFKASLGP